MCAMWSFETKNVAWVIQSFDILTRSLTLRVWLDIVQLLVMDANKHTERIAWNEWYFLEWTLKWNLLVSIQSITNIANN